MLGPESLFNSRTGNWTRHVLAENTPLYGTHYSRYSKGMYY